MRAVVDKISALLFRLDPVRLQSRFQDEYDLEARIIFDLLGECANAYELQVTVRETFAERFGERVTGSLERYTQIAAIVWGYRRSISA
jgi:hypothetical protein